MEAFYRHQEGHTTAYVVLSNRGCWCYDVSAKHWGTIYKQLETNDEYIYYVSYDEDSIPSRSYRAVMQELQEEIIGWAKQAKWQPCSKLEVLVVTGTRFLELIGERK